MTRAHSRLGASAAERWMACPGSVLMSDGIPDQPTEYAMEGTAAHTVAEACLREGTDAATWLGKEVAVGDRAFPVDVEMAEAVQIYLDAVRGDLVEGARLEVETTFALHSLYPGLFGTNDACVYDPKSRTLRVYDYKHGYRSVEVANNPQLMYYALGASMSRAHMPLSMVELVIVQPRSPHPDGPVRRWSVAPADLLDWSAELYAAARKTEPLDAPLVFGEHCEYCPAGHVCSERRGKALSTVGMAGDKPAPPEPSDLSPQDLGDLLNRIRLVESWMKRVRNHAYSEAVAGRPPIGWKIVEKRPTRRWTHEEDVVERLHDHGLVEADIFEKKLLSPAKVDKLLGKRKTLLADLVVKESSGTTLVPESDRRVAVVPALLDFKPKN